jgi:hypothetical protein
MEQSTENDGTIEARTAARWWADHLGPDSTARNGDAMNEMFALAAKSTQAQPDPDQVEAFRAHLEQGIIAMLRKPFNAWEKAVADGPRWGASLRTIGVDYGPDAILGDALEAAGIPARRGTLLLPLKTTMWVNPGQVKVGLGYNAPPVELELVGS